MRDHLLHVVCDQHSMTFDEVAGVVGDLPQSTCSLPQWWANNSAPCHL